MTETKKKYRLLKGKMNIPTVDEKTGQVENHIYSKEKGKTGPTVMLTDHQAKSLKRGRIIHEDGRESWGSGQVELIPEKKK